MYSTEIKFLLDGVIFPAQVFASRILNSINGYEFTISLPNRYLVAKYRESYCFIFENNRFQFMHATNEKEYELIKILQEAITSTFSLYRKEESLTEGHFREIDSIQEVAC